MQTAKFLRCKQQNYKRALGITGLLQPCTEQERDAAEYTAKLLGIFFIIFRNLWYESR